MINLKKNDPVAEAIKQIIEKDLSPKQKRIAALAGDKKAIDALDLAALRAGKKPVEEETVEENAFDYKSPRPSEPNGGSGVKKGTRYGGSKQKDKPEHDEDKMKKEDVENIEEANRPGFDWEKAVSHADKMKAAGYERSGPYSWRKKKADNPAPKTPVKEDAEQIDEKNWIAGAIKHPGAETAAAKKAGMSVQAYAQKHQHDSGTAGKRARLAMTLKKMKENYEESVLDEMINEVLSKDATAGDWIHDFVHSDNPKFAGKSKAQRKKQALAAYYAKQRNEEVVEEGLKDAVKTVAKKAFKALTGGSDKDHLERLKKDMKKEEVEPLEEGKMDRMSLTHLWHAHAKHSYSADQGYGHGVGNPYHNSSAATAIENHVRKKHGNKVADDMVNHSDLHVAHAEYVGPGESKKVEHDAEKLRKKHGIKGDLYGHHEEHTVKEEVVSEAKGPTSQQDDPFVVADNNVPLNNAKTLAAKTMKRMKNEMLGKAGTTSEEIDPSVKSTDTLKGRIAGGKKDDVGPGADGKSTKVKYTPGPK